jgi:hypothetical protein
MTELSQPKCDWFEMKHARLISRKCLRIENQNCENRHDPRWPRLQWLKCRNTDRYNAIFSSKTTRIINCKTASKRWRLHYLPSYSFNVPVWVCIPFAPGPRTCVIKGKWDDKSLTLFSNCLPKGEWKNSGTGRRLPGKNTRTFKIP